MTIKKTFLIIHKQLNSISYLRAITYFMKILVMNNVYVFPTRVVINVFPPWPVRNFTVNEHLNEFAEVRVKARLS